MDNEHLKLITNIIKPWEEFNLLLAQPFAVQPQLSEFTRVVDKLAIFLSHWGETDGTRRKNKSLMNDIADTAKHNRLRTGSRQTIMEVSSCFYCDDMDMFTFLRNVAFVKYESNEYDLREYDFMKESLSEIKEIMNETNLSLGREIAILEAISKNSSATASLKFHEKYCVRMAATNLRFFKKDDAGNLRPYDPPNVEFVVY